MSVLNANDVMLEVNTGTTLLPVWKMVACITSNDLTGSNDDIVGDSKCGALTLPGNIKFTGSFTGFYKTDPTATEISGGELLNMYQNKTLSQWRERNADSSFYRQYKARLSNYKETYDYNTVVSFNAELNAEGAVSTLPVTS